MNYKFSPGPKDFRYQDYQLQSIRYLKNNQDFQAQIKDKNPQIKDTHYIPSGINKMKSTPRSTGKNHRTPEKGEDLGISQREKRLSIHKGKTIKLAVEAQKVVSLNWW